MSNRDRIVRLQAVDKRYRDRIYPSIPVKDETINAYLTGQHIDPKDPSTHGNLTMGEMIGKVQLSPDKMKKFPYVIYVENQENGKGVPITYPLKHGDKVNIARNSDGSFMHDRDIAVYNYWLNQPIIATEKSKVIPGETMFYIEDLLAEAEKRVELADRMFEAESLIRSSNINQYRDIALLLNHNVKNFNINVSVLTELQIKDKLIKAAKDHTQEVIDCFSKGVEKDLFILKLTDRKIITLRNGSFYDGNMFLGKSLDEVKSFMQGKEGEPYLTKWGRLLENIIS